MALKLSFNSEIHRVSKPPVNFNALITHSQALFSSKLPTRWALEYIDEEDDRVVLANDHDYQTLLDDVSKGKTVKIFIVERTDLTSSPIENNYEVLEAETQEVPTKPDIKEVKIVQADHPKEESKINEPESVYAPQLQEAQQSTKPSEKLPMPRPPLHHKFKVLALMKQLNKANLPQDKRETKQARIASLMSKLSPEDLQWVSQQQQQQSGNVVDEKLGKRKERAACKPHLKFKAAGLIKKLSEKDLPNEVREEKETKLNQIKAKLSPEDLQWATEHAKSLPANDQTRAKCKMGAPFRVACILRKMASPELPKEERQRLEEKLTQLKAKLSPEEFQNAEEKAKSADPKLDEECRKPALRFKVRNILRRLMFEPEMSPDDRKELEQKLSELKAQMPPEAIAWVDEKVAQFQDKLKKIQSKKEKTLKEKITTFLKESAGSIAGLITKGEKMEKPRHIISEFATAFETLSEEKKKEFNDLLKGIPQKIVDMETERKKQKEEKKTAKVQKSRSRSKSRPKESEDKPRIKRSLGKCKKQDENVEKIKVEEPKQYEKGVSRKADCLKEIFPEAELEKLLEFVAANNKLSTEELVESYLANKN